MTPTKTINIAPVTGFLDTRSTPDEVPFGGYRWAENMEVTTKHRLCRMPGWRRLLDSETYNNADLHDQLAGYAEQPLTFGFQAESPSGFSKLFVGTQNRIYALNNASKNWKVISDLLGGDADGERRWRAGQVNNVVYFVNGYDDPVYHIIDQPAHFDGEQSVSTVRDLVKLNVTKVNVVLGWNNLLILANFVQDGQRAAHRLMWSDYKRPLSFLPSTASLAGTKDLDTGESILAILPLIDRLLVYTTRGIWEGFADGNATLAFARRYRAPQGSNRCLAFPNTLVSTGSEHYYWGIDGIYKYSLYDPEPVLVDWIHRASSTVFDDLERGRCKVHCGAYYPHKKSIYWSWARSGESVPSMTIVVNTEFPFVSFIPEGFSVLMNYEPDAMKSLRDWILEQCICTPDELALYGAGLVKEGGYCTAEEVIECNSQPNSFFSTTEHSEVVEATDYTDGLTIVSEDYTGTPDPLSLYVLLSNVFVKDICAGEYEADQCNADELFVGVWVGDNCIKEFSDEVFYREKSIDKTKCTKDAYLLDGYRSRMFSGAIHMKDPGNEKVVQRFEIEAHVGPSSVPAQLILKTGMAAHAVDPIGETNGRCTLLWETQDVKTLECLSPNTEAQHRANGTRPDDTLEWALYNVGKYFYFSLEIVNENTTPKHTGGNVCFSRYSFDLAMQRG